MDNLWAEILLGQKEPSFWRLLSPLLVIVGIAVFGWLNEKAKQKERQQQGEEDARRQGEEGSRAGPARSRQGQPVQRAPSPQAQGQRSPRAAQPIHRYQPQIPSVPGAVVEQAQEPELVIVAEDVSGEVAQRQSRREQQRLRAEAVHRAQALQAQRSREARPKAKPVRPRTLEVKREKELSQMAAFGDTEVSQPRTALLGPGEIISQAQIRRAIVWAEILGAPRALRPYGERLEA